MTTPTTPKYRTDTQACSCLGFWYRRTCKHFRAYGEAVALIEAQEAVNEAFSPIGVKLTPVVFHPNHHTRQLGEYG